MHLNWKGRCEGVAGNPSGDFDPNTENQNVDDDILEAYPSYIFTKLSLARCEPKMSKKTQNIELLVGSLFSLLFYMARTFDILAVISII